MCCQIQWSDRKESRCWMRQQQTASTCGRCQVRRGGGLLQGCPSDLGWDEASVRGQPYSTPLPHLRGWLLYFPPGTLDCLLVRDISYSQGWCRVLAMPKGTGQSAGTEGLTVAQISKKVQSGPQDVILEGVLICLQLPSTSLCWGKRPLRADRVDEIHPHSLYLSPWALRTLR